MANWSPADVSLLCSLAAQPGADMPALAAALQRSRSSIKMRMSQLKIKLREPRPSITSGEIEIVRSMARAGHDVSTISTALHRAVATVRLAAAKHGIEIKSPRCGCQFQIDVSQAALNKIRRAAAERDTTATALCAKLIERIAERDLFGAIIGDGEKTKSASKSAEPETVLRV